MGIPLHSPWLSGDIDVAQTVLVMLTTAGQTSVCVCVCVCVCEFYFLIVGEAVQGICCEKEVGTRFDKDRNLCSTVSNWLSHHSEDGKQGDRDILQPGNRGEN